MLLTRVGVLIPKRHIRPGCGRRGERKLLKKWAREAFEVVIASLAEDRAAVVRESVDLFYYLLLLWSDCGVSPSTVWAEMHDRFGHAGVDRHKERLV